MPFCPHCKKNYDKDDGSCPICGHPDDCECGLEFKTDLGEDDYYDDGDDADDKDYSEEEE